MPAPRMTTDWGAPDLVVEVMSPRPRIGRLDERLAWFAKCGVRECWLVRPEVRQIEVISFTDGAATNRRVFMPQEPMTSRVLPALKVTPESILTSA